MEAQTANEQTLEQPLEEAVPPPRLSPEEARAALRASRTQSFAALREELEEALPQADSQTPGSAEPGFSDIEGMAATDASSSEATEGMARPDPSDDSPLPEETGTDEEVPSRQLEPIEVLVVSPRPRFLYRYDLRLALGQMLELFPQTTAITPGAAGVHLRSLALLFIVSMPALVVVGTIGAVMAAGLGNFVGAPVRVSLSGSLFTLIINAGTTALLAGGASLSALWAARITRTWHASLVGALAGIGALLLGAATFFPLFTEVAFARMDGQLGPFAVGWLVVAISLLIGPTLAALLTGAAVNANRLCKDTGRMLSPELRVRYGVPEGLAALEAIENEDWDLLVTVEGLPPGVENFIELNLYMAEGAAFAIMELEVRFWAEVGPEGETSESSAWHRKARRWLVHSQELPAEQAQQLMGMNWQGLAALLDA